ncbi:NADH dehydrogenase [ubiquinone] 1 alpha subcomplex assembly factor 8 isoform X2 [Tympanuchus pallidicinctus]|uniref:NADH dehydrogenase [ubiquinone] 1 alpha subcomplex assembly factor 8 isoform X2 n=2 Tax=Tetraoninae TaxID=466585 RepID=UPI00228745BA|nr:NADH dehydrogenase [ubiquinone] 1 alpha subcomplex assembly factor 8 isoform X2 [Tympanuchus pallidicinctus]
MGEQAWRLTALPPSWRRPKYEAMSGRGVWLRARARLRRFPALLAGCGEQASAYGRCVAAASAGSVELRRDVCLREFQALRECFARAAAAAK